MDLLRLYHKRELCTGFAAGPKYHHDISKIFISSHCLICSCFWAQWSWIPAETPGNAFRVCCTWLLRKQVLDRNPAIFRNPSGDQSRKPCKICGGQRPPLLEAQPWQLHSSKSGIQVGHGGVCSPCIWAQRVGRNRSEWPHWESFRLGQWSPHRGVKRAALSPWNSHFHPLWCVWLSLGQKHFGTELAPDLFEVSLLCWGASSVDIMWAGLVCFCEIEHCSYFCRLFEGSRLQQCSWRAMHQIKQKCQIVWYLSFDMRCLWAHVNQ